MSVPLMSAVLAALAAVAAGQSGISTERVDLYQGDPHVVHLDNSTFYDALLHKPHAWAMEFYMDWCGHCQRFAPVWSEVARRTKDWGVVVKVGAINCARRRNNPICRHYRIHGVPHVKLFGPGATSHNPGVSAIQHDPDKMVNAIVEFVTRVQTMEQPEGWPTLTEYSDSAQQLLRNPEPLQALVLESPGSLVGRTVQLDLSAHQHLVRVSRTSQPPSDLADVTTTPPTLVIPLSDGHQHTVTPAPGEVPRDVFIAALRRLIGVAQQPTPAPTAAPTASTPSPTRAPADMVFMVDMENAIVVALKQEVTSHAVIEGEKLVALRRFLRTLLDLFPGRRHLMEALRQLLRTVSERESFTGAFLERVITSSSPWWPGLPVLQPYQACRGSRPNYRGYTCGLWTLFHTLTVQELRYERPGQNHTATVLSAVHGYVKNFFSCKHCSRHFQQMAAEDGLFSVTAVKDSVIWLWRAHNKVNKRIAGDLTEDPLHPKRQFPDQRLCPSCFDDEESDEYAVAEFLVQFYGAENFRGEGLDPVPVASLAAGRSNSSLQGRAPQAAHQPVPTQDAAPAQSVPAPRADPVHTYPTSDQRVLSVPSAATSLPADHTGSSSLPVVTGFPLVRGSLPPPAVLPPPPGSLEVVPGIMRYPSEMTHVFPTVLRAAPAADGEVSSGLSGGTRPVLVRAQRRVMYARPRVVYAKPRVVYTRPRVVYARPRMVYTQPRVVHSQPRVVYPLYQQQRSTRFQ